MNAASIPKPAGMVRPTERATRFAAAVMGALLAVFAGQAALLRLGESLVSLSYDMPFLVHHPGHSGDLRIVYLDQLNQDMLDRRPQARLLDKLGEAGAKAVVYDVIFDRASDDPKIDEEFAAAIRRFRGVDANNKPLPGVPQRHVFLACGRKTFKATGFFGEQLFPPTDVLLDAANDFGIVAYDDDEFTIRKLLTGSQDEPSLVWKAATTLGANLDEDSRLQPRWINFAGPPDRKKSASSPTFPAISATSVLQEGLSAAFFRDKIVVVGGEPGIVGEALGKDLFATPFHRFQIGDKLPLMSGVEVQANALANLMQRDWLTRSSMRFDQAMIAFAGIILGAGLTFLRPIKGILSSVALISGFAMAGAFAMNFQKFWFPWSVVAFAQVPVALVWGIAAHSYIERFFRIKLTAEQEAIRAAFAKYLSPQMLDRLTVEGFKTNLGGEKIEAAMMFTDLEAFTDMCERVRDPERIVETLNDYFERTTGHIFDHDGVIIKFIGDAIYAAWGAPIADPDAAVKAVRAAWKLHQSDKLEVDGQDLRTRIGIHFGEVVAGNVGSARRVDYTLIGDAVNLAARLESLNKMFGTSILMSDAVHEYLNGEFRTRRVGRFRVKGRKEATLVHELLGPVRQDQEPEWIGEYHSGLAALDEDDTTRAMEHFKTADTLRGPQGDGPSRFFMAHVLSGEPMPSGVVEFKEK